MSDDKKIDRTLHALGSANSSEQRGLRWRLKQANKTMGRQGQTIANLRGELARVRAENSKIERGELRRLENFEIRAQEAMHVQDEELARLREENRLLREKLEGHQ